MQPGFKCKVSSHDTMGPSQNSNTILNYEEFGSDFKWIGILTVK